MDQNWNKLLRREKSKNDHSRSQKIENARRLRGIHFIDLEDGEYKETIKKLAEKIGSSDGGGYALQERDKVKKELIEPASGNWKAKV